MAAPGATFHTKFHTKRVRPIFLHILIVLNMTRGRSQFLINSLFPPAGVCASLAPSRGTCPRRLCCVFTLETMKLRVLFPPRAAWYLDTHKVTTLVEADT